MKLYLFPGFDKKLLPVPASKARGWWQDNEKTRNHARHCLPLVMANSLGHYIVSPLTFSVEWNGDSKTNALIHVIQGPTHGVVDDHAAFGSFVVQPGFVPMTDKPGDFLFVKGIPNENRLPYQCMEAIIEAWWNPATFGLVFLLNQAAKFVIEMGQPIAQMFVFRPGADFSEAFEVIDDVPNEYAAWAVRRDRPEYRKDLDYYRGLHPDGRQEAIHICSWRNEGRDSLKIDSTEKSKAD